METVCKGKLLIAQACEQTWYRFNLCNIKRSRLGLSVMPHRRPHYCEIYLYCMKFTCGANPLNCPNQLSDPPYFMTLHSKFATKLVFDSLF